MLGISQLLAEIEHSLPSGLSALRVAPQANALGMGSSARWEVLGTLNVDPALLSSIVRSGGRGDRMLWEWRPSWLASGDGDRNELAKRAYHVVARVPTSLAKGLAIRQGLAESRAQEMITELGRRGIGLASLQAAGGTQESAAAGHFYATRGLASPHGARSTTTLGHPGKQHFCRTSSNRSSGSNLVWHCRRVPSAPGRSSCLQGGDRRQRGSCHVVPIEVKHHGQPQSPSPLPAENDPELRRAREQLKDASKLVKALSVALDPSSGLSDEPAAAVIRRQACAVLLDLALSFAMSR